MGKNKGLPTLYLTVIEKRILDSIFKKNQRSIKIFSQFKFVPYMCS